MLTEVIRLSGGKFLSNSTSTPLTCRKLGLGEGYRLTDLSRADRSCLPESFTTETVSVGNWSHEARSSFFPVAFKMPSGTKAMVAPPARETVSAIDCPALEASGATA